MARRLFTFLMTMFTQLDLEVERFKILTVINSIKFQKDIDSK